MFQIKERWEPFFACVFEKFAQIFSDFAKVFTDFAQTSLDFSRSFTKSKLLFVRLQPLHPRPLHHCVKPMEQ